MFAESLSGRAMKIAIFDYIVSDNIPIGGCHRKMLQHLADEFEFSVYARECDNPNPEKIRVVRIPAIRKPLALFFISFLISAQFFKRKAVQECDIIQGSENYCLFPQIAYVHFCHRAFLKLQGPSLLRGGLLGVGRFLDHFLRALLEKRVYARARFIVVPSGGLLAELVSTYPELDGKVRVIPNPIDVDRMNRPASFDSRAFRSSLGFSEEDTVFSFAALGHFERKGLPLLLEAMRSVDISGIKLLVIGGNAELLAKYQSNTTAMGLGKRVVFTGTQKDIRPFLWMSDAFVFPSSYETFSLVAHEAAAGGLPVICTDIYGVQDWLQDEVNGLAIDRSVGGLVQGLHRFCKMPESDRLVMGRRACDSVKRYSLGTFVENWRDLYLELENAR